VTIVVSHALVAVFGRKFLTKNSERVTQAVTLSSSSKETLDRLSNAEQQLSIQKKTVQRAREITARGNGKSYQETIIRDLNNYAKIAGVEIKSYTFDSSADMQKSTGPRSKEEAKSAAAKNIPGLKIETATVALKSPMNYTSLMKFLRLIEGNVLQLRPQSLNISETPKHNETGEDPSGTLIEAPSLTFEVYVKS
jgi:hypothetical protein